MKGYQRPAQSSQYVLSATMGRMAEDCLAHVLEKLYATEPKADLYLKKLLMHCPLGCEERDSEDIVISAGDMFDWLCSKQFNHVTHPRLYSASELAKHYDFFTSIVPCGDHGAGLSFRLMPKRKVLPAPQPPGGGIEMECE
jgi:hypothetical protein